MQAVIKDLDKALNDAERYEDEFSLERFSALVTGDARDA